MWHKNITLLKNLFLLFVLISYCSSSNLGIFTCLYPHCKVAVLCCTLSKDARLGRCWIPWTLAFLTWRSASCYRTDQRKGTEKQGWEDSEHFIVLMVHLTCSHFLQPPLIWWWCGLTLPGQIQMVPPRERLRFFLQGQMIFRSSVCEGIQSIICMMYNTHSLETSCSFPRLTSLEHACSHWHQKTCTEERKSFPSISYKCS